MTQNHRTLQRGVLGVIALLGALVPSGAALAGSYPPSSPPPINIPIPGYFNPQITTSPNRVVAGATFTVRVTPCVKDTLIPITFLGVTKKALCTNPLATATFRAPTTPGTYIITVRAYTRTVTYQVIVVAGSGGGTVPSTGASGIPMSLSIGTSAILTGLGLYFIGRRRHRIRLAG